jgi:aspartyl protease family protein
MAEANHYLETWMPNYQGPWSGLEPPSPPDTPPRPWRQDSRIRLVIVLGVALALGAGVWGLTRLFPAQMARADWPTVSYQIAFLALISLSLFSRGLKLGETVRYIAIWSAVFAALAVGYAYRGEMLGVALRLRSELLPAYAVSGGPHELVLTQDADGGYSVMGQVNGQAVHFAVDTGSSDIVLAPADAARLGIDIGKLDFARHFETANGVGDGASYTAQNLAVGPIKLTNVPMSINRAPMSTSLLGMAFLKRMQSFEVKDGRLYLRW